MKKLILYQLHNQAHTALQGLFEECLVGDPRLQRKALERLLQAIDLLYETANDRGNLV